MSVLGLRVHLGLELGLGLGFLFLNAICMPGCSNITV